ncbi:hypothetical protein ACFP1I_26960 [Dyadobacter subterraneus]|uniref:Uncharacterized protein n=1 Tax=Dyadobacter subterraneus TaxID=2773304 RepID=A0ABR9WJ84_9BACT|nr:hypothetical protein [Dyadobacter subterraneus]MBE9465577.1 hypothetical protein [Dyadobacter subterraneus]
MKKHPVDDLFKKRLASLERQPSELAWERIQQGQKNKSRRIAAWVWYAAASVSMALISGYVVWQNQNDTSEKLSNQTEMARVEKTIPETKPVDIPQVPETIDQIAEKADVPANDSSVRIAQNSKVQKDPKIREVKKKDQYQETKSAVERSINADVIQVAVIRSEKPEEIKANKIETQQAPATEKINIKPVEVAKVEDKKADRTILVEIEEPKNEFKDKKPSRLARVFRQLKNVREAEPVDWDDVGFNPKNILARVDDRPNTNDEKGSGKGERKN